jgi:hypothetical protein
MEHEVVVKSWEKRGAAKVDARRYRDLESVEQYISCNNPSNAIDTLLEIIRRVEMHPPR